MPATRRRSRKPRGTASPNGGATPAPQAPARVNAALAPWNWKTFPVYFAFALGGFIGLYLGIISEATHNSIVSLVVFVVFASLLGFGLSRITTRFMLTHNWVKPRPPRKK